AGGERRERAVTMGVEGGASHVVDFGAGPAQSDAAILPGERSLILEHTTAGDDQAIAAVQRSAVLEIGRAASALRGIAVDAVEFGGAGHRHEPAAGEHAAGLRERPEGRGSVELQGADDDV